MQVFFIRQGNYFKLFKSIELIEDEIIINNNFKKINNKKKIKIVNKIKKLLDKNNVNTVILEKNLKDDDIIKNLLYSNNLNIIMGNYLYKLILIELIEKESNLKNIDLKDFKIAFTVNNVTELLCKSIKELSKITKNIRIVTNNCNILKKFQEDLLEENGIIITCTNNKKKSLVNANLIFNIDFPNETLNKYRINDDAIIISMEEKIKIDKKRFCGKIVNNYKVDFKENSKIYNELKISKFDKYDLKDITECYITKNLDQIDNIIVI